jgi:hypothetical protein
LDEPNLLKKIALRWVVNGLLAAEDQFLPPPSVASFAIEGTGC